MVRAGRTRTERGRSDRGSVTVLMLGVITVALVLAIGLGALARSTNAQARAQGAADLAALAAAHEYARGDASGCRAEGPVVQVHVAVPLQPLPGWRTSAHAGARAGPVGMAPRGDNAGSLPERG